MIRTDAVHSPPRTLTGFLADSDRPGFRRLYLTTDRDYHAEFRTEAIVDVALVPASEPPFVGSEAVRVTLQGDEPDYTRTPSSKPEDEFDLDVESPKPSADAPHIPQLTDSCEEGCNTADDTCETCDTQCDQATCRDTCFGDTCGDAHTCEGGCTQATCVDCPDTVADQTCVDCPPGGGGPGGGGGNETETCETCATCQTCETCVTDCADTNCCPVETLEGHTCIGATACEPDLCLIDP
jgi:hypothetical protein